MADELASDSSKYAELICQCCSRLCRIMNGVLAENGLNISQCQTLSTLCDEEPGMTMGELSSALGVTMGAATNLVDRLLASELVERERGKKDRRVVRVKLTDTGREALDRDRATLAAFWSGIIEHVPPEERRSFFESYERLLRLAEGASAKRKK
ncbi:MAG TPA: MarR family transcriptional regulator [Planctomycetota bacterium]|nr:MarR family transcriptional regulator [Planctomycetota bacterium]